MPDSQHRDVNKRAHIGICALGASGSGKSSLLGRWAYAAHAFTDAQLEELRTQQAAAAAAAKTSSSDTTSSNTAGDDDQLHRWFMDKTAVERSDFGYSVHVSKAYMKTARWRCNIVDVPGKLKYMKNTIDGLSMADVALLVVDASDPVFAAHETQMMANSGARRGSASSNSKKGSLRTGAAGDDDEETAAVAAAAERESSDTMVAIRTHLVLAYSVGVRRLIVAVNKMDRVAFSEKRFDAVSDALVHSIRKCGYDLTGGLGVSVVPVSALAGDNLVHNRCAHRRRGHNDDIDDDDDDAATTTASVSMHGDNMAWYTGPSLSKSLDLVPAPTRLDGRPLRLPVRCVYRHGSVAYDDSHEYAGCYRTTLCGRVEAGRVRKGDVIVLAPMAVTATVVSLHVHGKPVRRATAGDSVGVGLALTAQEQRKMRRGAVMGLPDLFPPGRVTSFQAQLTLLSRVRDVRRGAQFHIHLHTTRQQCRLKKLYMIADARTGATLTLDPESIREGDCALVQIDTPRHITAEPFNFAPRLGCFLLRDGHTIVGVGVITTVDTRNEGRTRTFHGEWAD